jgi:hypothetical protein
MRNEHANAAALPKLRSSYAARSNDVAIWKLPDLYIFECRACGVTHIDAVEIEVA